MNVKEITKINREIKKCLKSADKSLKTANKLIDSTSVRSPETDETINNAVKIAKSELAKADEFFKMLGEQPKI